MNRNQKMAWFVIINFTVAIVLSVTVFAILLPKIGASRATSAIGFMGICGFSGFANVIFKKDSGLVDCDERDIMIMRKAAIAGFASAYLFVGLACMLPFIIMGPSASIRVIWLPGIFGGAGILHYYMHSIVLLVLYGKGDERK